jgi:hypothetical protein
MSITVILVVGDVATPFYHLLESQGHGLRQVLEAGEVLHPDDPQLQDLLLLLLNTAFLSPSEKGLTPFCMLAVDWDQCEKYLSFIIVPNKKFSS